MLTWVAIGAVVILFLGRNLIKRFASDRIGRLVDGRRGTSRLVTRGEFIDGSHHQPVSLSLGKSALYYESSKLQGSLDLDWVGEVEYENEVVTGPYVGDGKILRLHCFGQEFAFLVPTGLLEQWQTVLPAYRKTTAADAEGSAEELRRAEDEGWPIEGPAATRG